MGFSTQKSLEIALITTYLIIIKFGNLFPKNLQLTETWKKIAKNFKIILTHTVAISKSLETETESLNYVLSGR